MNRIFQLWGRNCPSMEPSSALPGQQGFLVSQHLLVRTEDCPSESASERNNGSVTLELPVMTAS